MTQIRFDLKFVPAGTGSAVWDNPYAVQILRRFMPPERQHGPMIGILHLGAVRPTPGVIRDVIVMTGEDVRAGRYGNHFTFFVSSEDEATRGVVKDIAQAQNLAIFLSSSTKELEGAEAVGDLTSAERETLALVLRAGGTVTSAEFAERIGVEHTTAGNRLVALHRKGYLQRIARPHPYGDQFMDPRSVRFDLQPAEAVSVLSPEGSAMTRDIIRRYKGTLDALAKNERKGRER